MSQSVDRLALSRDLIVQTAITLADADGPSHLSMRRLGKALGVEAMSLYRYVNGREDLLEAVVDAMVAELEIDPERQFEPLDGWQAYLQWLAHAVRSLAQEHPRLFPLIATRHPAAPWIRPPLRSLRVVEDFLVALTSRGFSDAAAADAYRSFSSFLLGHLLLESAMLGADTAPVEEPLDEGDSDLPNADGRTSVARFPTVQRLEQQLTEDHTDEEFERALESLLVQLEERIHQ